MMPLKFTQFLKTGILATALAAGLAQAQVDTSNAANDAVTCQKTNLISGAMITDICWSCVMPIKVAGTAISGSQNKDTVPMDASKNPFCMCYDNLGMPKPGIVTSFWQPSHVFEFQRSPGCMSALNGVQLPFNKIFRGTTGWDNAQERRGRDQGFRHYHMYAFPVMLMLDIFVPKSCNPGGYADFDVMFLSEVDPTWNNDDLAFFAHFENALVANPIAVTACIPDAISSNLEHPMNTLWWCAGSWGGMYPLSGNTAGLDGVLAESSLMNARALAALHRRGFLHSTVGEDNQCEGQIAPRLPKSQYRFSMFHPVPETDDNHAFGEAPIIWGTGRTIPAKGEDPVYILWRWLDCCNT